MYRTFLQSEYGPLDPKVNLEPDFFTGFKPENRKAITDREAAFYHSITAPYSVDDQIRKTYITVTARDGYSIPVKVYRPLHATGKRPALLFLHGGGFITCTPETHDYVPSYLSAKAGCVCYSPDYRLAPEAKFPVGLQDCQDVLHWISDNADAEGVNANAISVGGDSSGGNFTAALTLLERGGIAIDKQVLIYPALDFTGEIPKRAAEVYAPVGSAPDSSEDPEPTFLERYLNPGDDLHNVLISPLMEKDLSGLPKALFIQAECDSLCDDGLMYAARLQDAGNQVICKLYKGMPHAFILRTYEETFAALDEIAAFLR